MNKSNHVNNDFPVICIADDRITSEPGIRLLIASLSRHSIDWPVELLIPEPSVELKIWLRKYPNVSLNGLRLEGEWHGYNIKPQLLIAILENGANSAIWIDSDIITMRSLSSITRQLKNDMLVITEEAMSSNHYDGDALRARSWGLSVGRRVPFQLNTGVVGVTARHIPLLYAWRKVLESREYISAYHMPWIDRPSYFAGDQEVLTSLLCSKEFSTLQLGILRRGRDIIQYFGLAGYSTIERLRHIFLSPPIFIHAQGSKPWLPTAGNNKGLLHALRGIGPYNYAALDYRAELIDTHWLSPISRTKIKGWRITAPFSGIGLSFVVDAFRILRWGHTGGEPRKGNKAIATYGQITEKAKSVRNKQQGAGK